MQYLELNEKRRHGTDGFPFEYYAIDAFHPRYLMNYHWHAEYELIRVLKGQLEMTLNEKTFVARPGDLVFVHGGTLHAGIPTDSEYECLVFDLNVFLRVSPACAIYIQKVIDRSAYIYDYFPRGGQDGPGRADAEGICLALSFAGQAFDALRQKSPGYELSVVGGIYQFFSTVFAHHLYLDTLPPTSQKEVRRTMQLRRVIDYIDHHMGTQVTLQQLADAASMSPKYFCRFFYQMTHHTPIEYLNLQRIEYACYVLTTTDEPVTSIALGCGFNDISYFIRTFKRYKGVTPGQYRG